MSYLKRVAALTACGAVVGLLMPKAALGETANVKQGALDELSAIYLKACYGWLKTHYRVDEVPLDQLTSALQELLREGMIIGSSHEISDGSYVLNQNYIERALAWTRVADKQPNCDNAPLSIMDVATATENVQRDQQIREEKQRKESRKKYWQEHADDPITLDYAQYSRSIAGRSAKHRKPAGTVRALTVSQYQAWENEMQSKWLHAVIGAGGNLNVMQMHDQCKADIAKQWINSFGYPDTALRAPVFGDAVLTLGSAIGSACGTQLLRLAGLPVTTDISTAGGR